MVSIGTLLGNRREPRRTLWICCGAHILHDGFTDLLYVFLPLWQAGFGLSLAEIGILKASYSAMMAALQVPAGLLAERIGERTLLAIGTAAAAAAFLLLGTAGGFATLFLCLVLGGAGASVQHPLGSSLTARGAEGPALRTAISIYNFSGDLGKMALPALAAALVALWNWRSATFLLGLLGLAAAAAVYLLLRPPSAVAAERPPGEGSAPGSGAGDRTGFIALTAIGIVDSATRTGFLTFLPFLLTAKGATVPTIGLALALVFGGGATGKFVCGILASRLGILASVVATECATSLLILAILPLPLTGELPLLPLLGIALNGTSSVLYGTVAELVPTARRARAFGVFYTSTIGASAASPALFGLLGDRAGVPASLALVGLMVLLVLPLTLWLRPALRRIGA